MDGIEDLLRRRSELLEEIDREIVRDHTREVSLLFTDIVGSTRFYELRGDIEGRQMVQAHNDLLFPIIASHGGRVLKTIGDSIMACFDDAARAVSCSVAMQQAIADHNAAASAGLRFSVRMGLHCGTAVVEEKDVFGDAVNTAARVESRADGGEILVTGAIRDRAGDCGTPLVFLGTETVRGRQQSVDFFSVNWQKRPEEEILASWRSRQGAGPSPAPHAATPEPVPGREPAPARAAGPRVTLGAPADVKAELVALPPLSARGNPFLNRVMVPHPSLFFGRRDLVRRIMRRLAGSRPQSLSLVGERRIGKSSLLNFLRSPVARLEALESPESCLFVFMDFQQYRALEPARFLELLLEQLHRQAGAAIEGVGGYDAVRRLCEAVGEAGRRLVFLFDEFEAVTKNPAIGPEFYSFLRSLANVHPVAFVTASGRNLKELCATHEISDSPFFNIFSFQTVGLLSRSDAESLVGAPSEARGVPLAPLASPIIEMGGRYPFFLQLACSAWYEFLESEGARAEQYAGRPVPGPVAEAFRDEAAPHFEFVLENLPAAEAEVLRSVAAGRQPQAADPAVHSLERKGYLAREGEGLVPFSQEFARFVRGT